MCVTLASERVLADCCSVNWIGISIDWIEVNLDSLTRPSDTHLVALKSAILEGAEEILGVLILADCCSVNWIEISIEWIEVNLDSVTRPSDTQLVALKSSVLEGAEEIFKILHFKMNNM